MSTKPTRILRFLFEIPLLLIVAAILAGCQALKDSSATRTAQSARNIELATQSALQLQSTDQVKETSTLQARRQQTSQAELNQQATIEVGTSTAQAQSLYSTQFAEQSTTTAQALQELIASAQTWPPLVVDPFDKPAYNWPTGSQKETYGSIVWKLENGKYLWNIVAQQGFTYWTYPSEDTVSDFYLAVEVLHTGGSPDAEAGLVFRASDQDYWCFLISAQGDLFIGLRVNDDWQLSLPLNSSYYHAGEPNHLAVLAQSRDIIFLLNGFNFITLGNGLLPSGAAGLMVEMWNTGDQSIVKFDNFEFRSPQAPLTTPEP